MPSVSQNLNQSTSSQAASLPDLTKYRRLADIPPHNFPSSLLDTNLRYQLLNTYWQNVRKKTTALRAWNINIPITSVTEGSTSEAHIQENTFDQLIQSYDIQITGLEKRWTQLRSTLQQ